MAMKKVTIRDVAAEAGVSVTLVSFVMNAKVRPDGTLDCPVNKDTAQRVLEVARKLGYKRNNAAASLRSGRSHTIGVITSDIANPFFANLCRYFENIAYKSGYIVLFASSDENPKKLSKMLDTFIGFNVEGLIVAPCSGIEEHLSRVTSMNIPVVLVDRDIPGDGLGRVMVDNVDAGYQATSHLLKKGHRKVEILSYTMELSNLYDREQGYRKAMIEAGLGEEIRIHHIAYEAEHAREDVIRILKEAKSRGTEGFVLPTKNIAMYTFSALNELGLKNPDDIDFVCYDESDLYDLNTPPVPHIVQPLEEIATNSFDLLERMIEGKEPETISLKTKLVNG